MPLRVQFPTAAPRDSARCDDGFVFLSLLLLLRFLDLVREEPDRALEFRIVLDFRYSCGDHVQRILRSLEVSRRGVCLGKRIHEIPIRADTFLQLVSHVGRPQRLAVVSGFRKTDRQIPIHAPKIRGASLVLWGVVESGDQGLFASWCSSSALWMLPS